MALAFDCPDPSCPDPSCPDAAVALDGPIGPFGETLYNYWLDIHPGGDRLPGRQHFDPVDLARGNPALLQHLWLVDVERDPMRFRLRLVGSAVYMTSPFARAGHCVDEFIDPASRTETLRTALARLVETGRPEFRCGRPWPVPTGRRARRLTRLSLPLAADGETVDMIISLTTDAWPVIDKAEPRRAG